jgi:hypothetical protein
MKSKAAYKIEVILIVFTTVILFTLWTVAFGNDAIDINLNDTYLVITNTKERVLVIPALLLITIIYFIKEAFYCYKRRFQNLVLLTSVFFINLILLFCVGLIFNISSQIGVYNHRWTIYPPLSALPKALPNNPLNPSPVFNNMLHILLVIQIIFLIILVIIAVITGKNWNTSKREHETP